MRLFALFALLGSLPYVAPHAQLPSEAERTRIDAVFASFATREGPGCALGIGRNGQLIYGAGYGMADLEHDIPITSSTPFYIASTSKQFAAFAIVLLARDGRLSFDDDVRRFVPELPDFGTPITVRHLLHHTSGLRDYFEVLGSRGWPFDGALTVEEFLRLVARQRELNFPPGSHHLYSNTGYVLLSVIVQRVSEKSLRQFAADRILGPLAMTRSLFRDDHRMLVPGRAIGYEMITGNTLRTSVPNFDVVGDGGLFSTTEDLVKWDGNAYTPKAGDAADWKTMLSRGVLNSGDTIPYAMGLSHGVYQGRPTVAHGGAFGGYRADLLRFPEERLGIAVLCNSAGANASGLALRVANVLLPARSPAPPLVPVSANDRAIPDGRYLGARSDRWVLVSREGDSLVASGPFARTAVAFTREGMEINSQRITLRPRQGAPAGEWEMSLGGTGYEPLVPLDATMPSPGAIAATMGEYVSPESDGRLTLIVESGQLTLRRVGAPPARLLPIGRNRFAAGPVLVTMLGAAPFDSLRVSTGRAWRVKYVRASR